MHNLRKMHIAISFLVLCGLGLPVATSSFASEVRFSTFSLTYSASDIQKQIDTGPELTPETQGIKSWIAKKALNSIANMIRSGGNEFIKIAGNFLDKGAKSAIKQHSGTIANAIDDVAKLPDLATHIVREKLFYALKGSLGSGTANVIADAVSVVMWIVL